MNYKEEARQARIKTLELIYRAGTSHIGSNFSAIDIMTVLFDKVDPQKDEVILSKGWAAASWYYFLHKKGIITEEELNSFCQSNSPFISLVEPQERKWGLRCAGGSMGFGLPFAVGFALSKKLKGEEGKIYCLMSDGEMQIGTTWECALIAAHHKLDNLIVIVDYNKFQAMGKTTEILNIEPLLYKWGVFGWTVMNIDGHDFELLENAITKDISKEVTVVNLMTKEGEEKSKNEPLCILAHTIKGKGVSFMENNNDWHYRNIDKKSYDLATKEFRQ